MIVTFYVSKDVELTAILELILVYCEGTLRKEEKIAPGTLLGTTHMYVLCP